MLTAGYKHSICWEAGSPHWCRNEDVQPNKKKERSDSRAGLCVRVPTLHGKHSEKPVDGMNFCEVFVCTCGVRRL